MKHILFCSVILLLAVAPVDARTVELTLHPAKAPEPVDKCQLLPKAEQQSDADAVPLYQKAIQAMPKNRKEKQIPQWLKLPAEQFPHKQAQETVQKYMESLKLVARAARCRECNWPEWESGTAMSDLSGYRTLIRVIGLWARLEILRGAYDGALLAMQTGFAMARHLGEGPTLVQGLVGIAVAAVMYQQLEQFIQVPDTPNLYLALQKLPRPLVDLTEQMEFEMPDPDSKSRISLLMTRLDRHVAALQCLEALRLHAGTHNGKFPNELSNVTEVNVPNDPVTGEPFLYSRTGSKAVLQGPAPKGADAEEGIRYELNLKENEPGDPT